jgi:hypothetical protein
VKWVTAKQLIRSGQTITAGSLKSSGAVAGNEVILNSSGATTGGDNVDNGQGMAGEGLVQSQGCSSLSAAGDASSDSKLLQLTPADIPLVPDVVRFMHNLKLQQQ